MIKTKKNPESVISIFVLQASSSKKTRALGFFSVNIKHAGTSQKTNSWPLISNKLRQPRQSYALEMSTRISYTCKNKHEKGQNILSIYIANKYLLFQRKLESELLTSVPCHQTI